MVLPQELLHPVAVLKVASPGHAKGGWRHGTSRHARSGMAEVSAMSMPHSRPLHCIALCLSECMKGTPKRKSPLPRSEGAPQAVCDSAINMTNQSMYIALSPSQPCPSAVYVTCNAIRA